MLNKRACMAYGSISLFTSLLHNIFLLYHVDIFLSIYKIDKMSFWIGEAIFLVWNSCNDPLFGWASDKNYLSASAKKYDNIILNRINAISRSGPLFALAFLTFWFALAPAALQFVACLCVYDAFLTIIDLQHSALLADLAIDNASRTNLNFYCSAFGVFGSGSVFISYLVWDHNDLQMFRVLCVVLALLSVVGFYVSTSILRQYAVQSGEFTQHHLHASESEDSVVKSESSTGGATSIRKYVSQVTSHRNFMWFSLMNIVQVFHCHFNSNFYPLFLNSLLSDDIPQYVLSIIIGTSFILPHLNNLYFLSICRTYGTYPVIRMLFIFKFLLAIMMLLCGRREVYFLCFYIASNRIFTEGTCKLLGLVISDLVDEDMLLHDRSRPVSALVFGTASFLSKPGQTLAPLIGTWLLTYNTGHDLFESGNTLGSIRLRANSSSEVAQDAANDYKAGVFDLLVAIPIACASIQLFAWSRYQLRDAALSRVKRARRRYSDFVVV